MKVLLATRNAHKVGEIRELLRGCSLDCLSLEEVPSLPEVIEDQPTLEGNARKKAVETARAAGLWALADDSGLEVAALDGAPGVYSARYAGAGCDYAANNEKLLREMADVPSERRQAAFRTVMALSDPQGREVVLEEGCLEGRVAAAAKGTHGFGYDPVFLVSGSGRTLAELSPVEKNAISHRARALAKMVPHLKRLAPVLLCLAFLAGPAQAGRTEPGQETIWDQIMASQAHRGLRVGSKYLDDKQYEAAVKEFTRAVQASPDDPLAHMMLGVAYYWTGRVDESLAEYDRSLQLDGRSAQTTMLKGISLAWKGDLKPAYEAFKRASELDGARADIQMNLGSIEETLGMVPESMEHFRKAVVLDPKNPLYHFQLGMLYRKLGRDQDSMDSMRQALKHFSGFEDALLELGAAEERTKDRKGAIRSFKDALSLKSKDSVARFRLGRLYLLTGEAKRARDIFKDAFHLTPEEGGPGLRLSVSYAGGRKRSPGQGGKAPAGQPEAPADPNDPLDVFSKNLERIPLEQSAVLQVDVVFVPKPKMVAAPAEGSALRRALQKQLTDAAAAPKAVRRDFTLRSGKAEEREAQIAKVMGDLRQMMKEAPADADARLGMNLTFTHLNDASPGKDPSGPAPKVSYQPRQVGNDLGLWVIGTGWMALVEEVLPEGDEAPSHPDESDWWVATGLGYATIGDGQRAVTAFEKACRLDPGNETAFLGFGVASVMMGNEDAAVKSYREALRLNPKNRPAKEGLEWLLRPSTRKAAP